MIVKEKNIKITAMLFSAMLLCSCGETDNSFEEFGTVVNNETMTAAEEESTDTKMPLTVTQEETTIPSISENTFSEATTADFDTPTWVPPVITNTQTAPPIYTELPKTEIQTTATQTMHQTTAQTAIHTTAPQTTSQTTSLYTTYPTENSITTDSSIEMVNVTAYSPSGSFLKLNENNELLVDAHDDGNVYLWFSDEEWNDLENLSMDLYLYDEDGYISLGNTFYCFNEVVSANGVHGIRLEFDGYWYTLSDGCLAEVLMDLGDGQIYNDDDDNTFAIIPCEIDNDGNIYYLVSYLGGIKYNSYSIKWVLFENEYYELWNNMSARLICDYYYDYNLSNYNINYLGAERIIDPNENLYFRYNAGTYMFKINIYMADGTKYITEPIWSINT